VIIDSIINSLGKRELLIPYLESAILSDTWPDNYTITVDSGEYYGKGDGYFHPSSHPLMGERQLYYLFHPDTRDLIVPERRSTTEQMTLSMGSAGHAILQTKMQMAGLITSPDDIEVEYVNHAHHVRGRIDWIAHHPNGQRLVSEFKTRNSFKFARQTEPEPSWVAQLNLALDAMDEDLGVLLMMESAWPWRFAEFHVKRDRKLLDSIYEKFDRVREAIATNTPPRHCCSLGSQEMDNCSARFLCWLKE